MSSTLKTRTRPEPVLYTVSGKETKYLATDTSPSILHNAKLRKLVIAGNSLREDAESFFQPIVDLIYKDLAEKRSATIEFHLICFNPKTAKVLFKLFENLKYFELRNRPTKIIWHYHTNNEAMKELGASFAELFELNFDLIPSA